MRFTLSGVESIAADECDDGAFSGDELVESAPLATDSPFQIYFSPSAGGYASGLIVGDFVFIVGVSSLWILRLIVKEKCFKKRQSSKFASILSLEFLAKAKVMFPFVNFTMIFLDPLFNTSIMLLFLDEVGIGWKILDFFIAVVVVFVGFICLVVIYKLLISRAPLERFRKHEQKCEVKNENSLVKLWKFLMGGQGEWIFPKIGSTVNPTTTIKSDNRKAAKSTKNNNNKVTSRDLLVWRISESLIEGFTDRFPRFMIVDIITMFGLTLAGLIGHFTRNCKVLGVLLFLPTAAHLALVIAYRPDNELLVGYSVAFADLIQLILVACALAGASDDVAALFAVLLLSVEVLLMILSLGSVYEPMWEYLQRRFQCCKTKKEDDVRKEKQQNSRSVGNNNKRDDSRKNDQNHQRRNEKRNVSPANLKNLLRHHDEDDDENETHLLPKRRFPHVFHDKEHDVHQQSPRVSSLQRRPSSRSGNRDDRFVEEELLDQKSLRSKRLKEGSSLSSAKVSGRRHRHNYDGDSSHSTSRRRSRNEM